jgi:hypothetical protein
MMQLPKPAVGLSASTAFVLICIWGDYATRVSFNIERCLQHLRNVSLDTRTCPPFHHVRMVDLASRLTETETDICEILYAFQ